jgi:hypothetical protein
MSIFLDFRQNISLIGSSFDFWRELEHSQIEIWPQLIFAMLLRRRQTI